MRVVKIDGFCPSSAALWVRRYSASGLRFLDLGKMMDSTEINTSTQLFSPSSASSITLHSVIRQVSLFRMQTHDPGEIVSLCLLVTDELAFELFTGEINGDFSSKFKLDLKQ